MKFEPLQIAKKPILLRLEKHEVLICEEVSPNIEFLNVAISFFFA
ncbi:MAG TPA: hypothetical protein VEG64_16115 [Candidatus Sulfotelmatobacter sp.]|nr:hypothetical protein [Candidatus Sulfotelmatobacter sp.]